MIVNVEPIIVGVIEVTVCLFQNGGLLTCCLLSCVVGIYRYSTSSDVPRAPDRYIVIRITYSELDKDADVFYSVNNVVSITAHMPYVLRSSICLLTRNKLSYNLGFIQEVLTE